MVHCRERGDEVIVGDLSHLHIYEQGGSAQVSVPQQLHLWWGFFVTRQECVCICCVDTAGWRALHHGDHAPRWDVWPGAAGVKDTPRLPRPPLPTITARMCGKHAQHSRWTCATSGFSAGGVCAWLSLWLVWPQIHFASVQFKRALSQRRCQCFWIMCSYGFFFDRVLTCICGWHNVHRQWFLEIFLSPCSAFGDSCLILTQCCLRSPAK